MKMHEQLVQWMKHPEQLNQESLFTLRTWLAHYPYFQTVRILYLKNLFLLGDVSFKEELRRASFYVADPAVLFYFIEGERYRIPRHAAATSSLPSEGDRTLDLIDRFLMHSQEEMPDSLGLPPAESVDYTAQLEQHPDVHLSAEESSTSDELSLIDDFLRETAEGTVTPPSVHADEVTEEPSADEAPDETDGEEDESYFTETLAKIYIRQHRYEKALEIIKKLNLKYPKKNTYFADQIRFLEKLIINAKSK